MAAGTNPRLVSATDEPGSRAGIEHRGYGDRSTWNNATASEESVMAIESTQSEQPAVGIPECPHCGGGMSKWEVPDNPFVEWDNKFMYVCFNDSCPFLRNGWDTMRKQGCLGCSYRQMYDPKRRAFHALSVRDVRSLREGIVSDSPGDHGT
jgi:hypothetical protein